MHTARKTDPMSSHLAAVHVSRSGQRATEQQKTVRAVKEYPGATSNELHEQTHLNRHLLARRLPECERRGFVKRGEMRRCTVSGRHALTWWPV